MKLIKVDKGDYLRIILTDTLPYEVPMIFSNEGFYHYLKSKFPNNVVNKLLTNKEKPKDYIPFEYKIRKNLYGHRTLAVAHPAIQDRVVKFYETYDSMIIHLCSKSSFSLRAPSRVASHYYEKEYARGTEPDIPNVEAEVDAYGEQPKHASSYFSYAKYNILYKFYESYEFHRLERRYTSLFKFDISKCFHSIYTHSISWAVKDKMFAKYNRGCFSFEREFDRLMTHGNHNETNGILVGPEFSRIFAEIILQRIDRDVESKMEAEGFIAGVDYTVRRYVDDYFLFYNDKDVSRKVYESFLSSLESFKLHVNETKIEEFSRPFVTDITCAKIDVKNFFNEMFASKLGLKFDIKTDSNPDTGEITSHIVFKSLIRSPSRETNNLIVQYKALVKRSNVTFDVLSGYALNALKKRISRILTGIPRDYLEDCTVVNISECIIVWIEFAFYLYSMDVRVNTTFLVSQIIVTVVDFVKHFDSIHSDRIKKKIYDESLLLIKTTSKSHSVISVELLNLLIAINMLGSDYCLPEKHLLTLFNLKDFSSLEMSKINMNYFQIVTLLFYLKYNSQLAHLIPQIEEYICCRMLDVERPMLYTEFACLLFDAVSCDIVSQNTKHKICEHVLHSIGESRSSTDVTNFIGFVSARRWFVDWDCANDLISVLRKKELRSPY